MTSLQQFLQPLDFTQAHVHQVGGALWDEDRKAWRAAVPGSHKKLDMIQQLSNSSCSSLL